MRWLGGLLAVILALPVAGYLAVHAYIALLVNPHHAAKFFADKFPVESTLASRRWHRLGAEAWDCTYAVVEISQDLPEAPPASWQADWKPTPAEPLGETTRDTLGFCSRYFSEDTQARMKAALGSKGAFYSRGQVGNTVLIYAPRHRIAARIRFDD